MILKAANEGGGDFLTFNGKQVAWYKANGNILDVYNGVSGMIGFQNPKYTNLKNKGPIPEGGYSIDLTLDPNRTAKIADKQGKLVDNYGIEKIPEGHLASNPWGHMRARLMPLKGTNTFGRTGFYFHDSIKGFTHGCIEVDSFFFDRLLEYQKSHSSINLYVTY